MGWWPFGKKAHVQQHVPAQEVPPAREPSSYSLEEALQHVIWSDELRIPLQNVDDKPLQEARLILIPARYSQGRLQGGFYHPQEGIRYQPIGFSYRTIQRVIPFVLTATSNEVEFHEGSQNNEKVYLPLHLSHITLPICNKQYSFYGLEGFPSDFLLALVFNTAEGLIAKQFSTLDTRNYVLKSMEWAESKTPETIHKIKKVITATEKKQHIPEPIQHYVQRQIGYLQEESEHKPVSLLENIIELGELTISLEKQKNKKSIVFDGRYVLEEPLGIGGSSIVYRAIDLKAGEHSPHRIVAVKLATREDQHFSAHVDAARDLLGLRHENLVGILDVSDKGEKEQYIVMDFIDGASLHEILKQYPTIDPSIACAVAKQVAAGLVACKDIMPNLDVKPSNILLSKEGIAGITDFGIKAPEKSQKNLEATDYSHLRSTLIEGTAGYISPEVEEKGISAGTHKSDMYSLGIVLYKMLIGHLPKSSERLHELRKDIPQGCDTIYAALTRLHPEDRWDGKTLIEKINTLEQKGEITPVRLQVKIAGRKILGEENILRDSLPVPEQALKKLIRPSLDEVLARKQKEPVSSHLKEKKLFEE